MIRKHLFFHGKVQGVSFRMNSKQIANKLGLKGWVKNLEDGRVEIVIEGEEKAVIEFIDYCSHKLDSARVVGVDVKDEECKGLSDYKIKY